MDDAVGQAEQVADFENALPTVISPSRDAAYPSHAAWQPWVNIIRVFAMSAGRAAAGSAVNRAEFERFYGQPLIDEAAEAWRSAQSGLDALWDRSGEAPDVLAREARGDCLGTPGRRVAQPLAAPGGDRPDEPR
jgi:hypothetical protein